MKKDLHIHSYYSDGALSPKEIVDRWAAEGYEMIAITDHDGIEGSEIVAEYADNLGLTFISGIEFDSSDAVGLDMHILGYGYDYHSPVLDKAMEWVIVERKTRNDAMMAALNKLGYSVSMDDLVSVNEGRFIGKPTFSQVLMRKGYADSVNEVFGTIFREPSIREIRKKTFPSEKIIEIIHESGGLAVLAHPMEQRHLKETYLEFEERLYTILDTMVGYGIDGVECYHPSADAYQSEVLREYAEAHGLIVTRGSDFHRDNLNRDFSRYHRP